MKYIFTICTAIACNLMMHPALAQDLEICAGDSVLLQLEEDALGEIFWQRSIDGEEWEIINTISAEELNIKVNQDLYTRAAIVDGDCDTLYSAQKLTTVKPVPALDYALISDTSNLYYMDVLSIDADPDLSYWFNFNDSIQTNYLSGDTLHFRSPFVDNNIQVVAKNSEGCRTDTAKINYQSLPVAKLKDDVFFLTDSIEQLSVDTTYDYKTLYFSKNIPSGILEVGKIIFGGDPEMGFIIRIESVVENDSAFQISGDVATMFDIIPEDKPFEEHVINIASLGASNARTGEEIHTFNLGDITLDLPIDGSVSASMGLKNLTFELTTCDPEIKTSVSGYHFSPGVSNLAIKSDRFIKVTLAEEFVDPKKYEDKFEIFDKEIGFRFFIGWLPVWGELELELNASLSLSLNFAVDLSDKIDYNFEVSKAEYFVDRLTSKSEFMFDYDKTIEYDFEDFDVNASQSFNFTLEPATPEVGLEFYGLVGPYVSFPWGVYASAEISTEEYWNANAVVKGNFQMGGKLEIPQPGEDEEITISYDFPSLFDTLLYNAPDSIEYVSGDLQAGSPGSTMPIPLVVKVVDLNKKPVRNAMVFFEADSTFGDKVGESWRRKVLTDGNGEAFTYWLLGEEEGYREVLAHVYSPEGGDIKGGPIVFRRECSSIAEGLPEDWWDKLEDNMKIVLNQALREELGYHSDSTYSIEKPSDEMVKTLFCEVTRITNQIWQPSSNDFYFPQVSDISILSRFNNLEYIRIISRDSLSGEVSFKYSRNLRACWIEGPLQKLDISKNKKLWSLSLRDTRIDSIDVSGNTELGIGSNGSDFFGNKYLSYLNVQGCKKLKYIGLSEGQLKKLVLGGNENLESLSIGDNELEELDISGTTSLTFLSLGRNKLSQISGLEAQNQLEYFRISGNNMGGVNLSDKPNLKGLFLNGTNISSLNLPSKAPLENIYIDSAEISNIDLGQNFELEELEINHTNITSLDLTQFSKLKDVDVQDNKLADLTFGQHDSLHTVYLRGNMLTSLELKDLPLLQKVDLYNSWNGEKDNPYERVVVENCPLFYGSFGAIKIDSADFVRIANCPSLNSISLAVISQPIELEGLEGLENMYLDTVIYETLNLNNFPIMRQLRINRSGLKKAIIPSIDSLQYLYLDNNELQEVIVDDLPKLESFTFNHNPLKKLQISNLPMATNRGSSSRNGITFNVEESILENVEISNCPRIKKLTLPKIAGQLTLTECDSLQDINLSLSQSSLNLSDMKLLQRLTITGQALSSLTLPPLDSLDWMQIRNTNLTSISINSANRAQSINLSGNKLSSITLPSDMTKLHSLNLSYNNFSYSQYKSIIDKLPCTTGFSYSCEEGVPDDNGTEDPDNKYKGSDCEKLREYINSKRSNCG